MSQLTLSLQSGVSARHISFIETGRSTPSRKLIGQLSDAMDLPVRERNVLFVAAGYAPIFAETDWQDEAMAPVRRAIGLILDNHEPYPAFVVDRCWNVLFCNRATTRLMATWLPSLAASIDHYRRGHYLDTPESLNAMRLVLAPDLLRPHIANWRVAARVLMLRLRHELRVPNPPEGLAHLYRELSLDPEVAAAAGTPVDSTQSAIVVPLSFDSTEGVLAFFSTIATIGTPADVTPSEIRIESMFPADEQTEGRLERLLRAAPPVVSGEP